MSPHITPCFVCGSAEGELFESTVEGHPFHRPCIERFRAEQLACLDQLIKCVAPQEERPRHAIARWLQSRTRGQSQLLIFFLGYTHSALATWWVFSLVEPPKSAWLQITCDVGITAIFTTVAFSACAAILFKLEFGTWRP